MPRRFSAVATWYARFPQIDDEDVLQLLDDAVRAQDDAFGRSPV
jgi:predicted phosphoribosyltransferase